MNNTKRESYHVVAIGIKIIFPRLVMSPTNFNRFFKKQVDTIDKKSLPVYSKMLIPCIKLTKNQSLKYRNSGEEIREVLKQFPMFGHYYTDIQSLVKTHRTKCKLEN